MCVISLFCSVANYSPIDSLKSLTRFKGSRNEHSCGFMELVAIYSVLAYNLISFSCRLLKSAWIWSKVRIPSTCFNWDCVSFSRMSYSSTSSKVVSDLFFSIKYRSRKASVENRLACFGLFIELWLVIPLLSNTIVAFSLLKGNPPKNIYLFLTFPPSSYSKFLNSAASFAL